MGHYLTFREFGIENDDLNNSTSVLVHHTDSSSNVGSILKWGFVFVPYPTQVASFLLPNSVKQQSREPGQFGMISFRESSSDESLEQHCKRFGCFGICVDVHWARKNGAKPVRYISKDNPSVSEFQLRMENAAGVIEDEIRQHPGDGFREDAFHNSAAARIFGAEEYATLIDAFRYFGPSENAWQREWRIPNPLADYNMPVSPSDAVARVVSGEGWPKITAVCRVDPSDVLYFLSPKGFGKELRSHLPAEYQHHEIREVIPHVWMNPLS